MGVKLGEMEETAEALGTAGLLLLVRSQWMGRRRFSSWGTLSGKECSGNEQDCYIDWCSGVLVEVLWLGRRLFPEGPTTHRRSQFQQGLVRDCQHVKYIELQCRSFSEPALRTHFWGFGWRYQKHRRSLECKVPRFVSCNTKIKIRSLVVLGCLVVFYSVKADSRVINSP